MIRPDNIALHHAERATRRGAFSAQRSRVGSWLEHYPAPPRRGRIRAILFCIAVGIACACFLAYGVRW